MLPLLFCLTGTALGTADTPGFAFLGAGYDLLEGNPLSTQGDPGFRMNLFDWQYTQGLVTTDQKWRIADKTTARAFESCSDDMSENIFNSYYTYQGIISNSFDIDVGFKGNDFSFGVDSRSTRNHTDSQTEIYAHVSALCTAYQLGMYTFDMADLNMNFQDAVQQMPEEYDADMYTEIIREFGTHFINQMNVGGRWGLQFEFLTHSYEALMDDSINVHAGIKVMADDISGHADVNHTNDQKTAYAVSRAIYKNSTFSTGGAYNPDPVQWMQSAKDAPMPVHMSLTRLDSLFTARHLPKETDAALLQTKKANFAKAIDGYCEYQQARTPGFSCTPPQPQPWPTPSPLGTDAIRRVCVLNAGGYYLRWQLWAENKAGPVSDSFSRGKTVCLDGTDMVAARGDKLGCWGKAVAGRSAQCSGTWRQYDVHSMMQANYKCTGGTLNIRCTFESVSKIGVDPHAARLA